MPPASVGPGRSADVGSPAQPPTAQPAAIQSPATQTAPTPAAPLQVAPVQPTPSQQPDALTTVEIKSRPVATIDPAIAPEAAPQQQEERGVLSVFKRILPDLRRPASAAALRLRLSLKRSHVFASEAAHPEGRIAVSARDVWMVPRFRLLAFTGRCLRLNPKAAATMTMRLTDFDRPSDVAPAGGWLLPGDV